MVNKQKRRTLKDVSLEALSKIQERHDELNARRIDGFDSLDFWEGLSSEDVLQMHQDRLLLLTLAETLITESELMENE